MSIKINLQGFEELYDRLNRAGKNADAEVDKCIHACTDVMQAEMKAQMQSAQVDPALISRMPPPTVEKSGNRYTGRVGYKKGTYNPAAPSDGYKIVFLNYGTPRGRKTKSGADRGEIKARGFIKRTKSRAKAKIKKLQEETKNEILKGLPKE